VSYRIQPLIWRAQIDATAQIVLLRMSAHADDDGGKVYPSIPSLASACGLRDRAVQNAIRRLRDIGALIEVRPADFASRRPTEYRLDLAGIEKLAGEGNRCTKDTGVLNAPVHQMRGPVHLKTLAGVLNAPESFIETFKETTSVGAVAPAGRYAWQGKVAKLSAKDYQTWKTRNHAIPDFDADLAGLDDWYDRLHPKGDAKRKDWFHAISASLAKSHQRWTAEIKNNPSRRGGDVARKPISQLRAGSPEAMAAYDV
jgi:biotin operon repressor